MKGYSPDLVSQAITALSEFGWDVQFVFDDERWYVVGTDHLVGGGFTVSGETLVGAATSAVAEAERRNKP